MNNINNINAIIADSIHYLHILLVLYILFGWIITPIKKIHYYILFGMFVILDWNDLDGECTLTRLENHFREKIKNTNTNLTTNTETGQPEFFRPLINKVFNTQLTTYEANRINYFAFTFVMTLAFFRMIRYYNINIL